MPQMRPWLKRSLPPTTLDALRSVRHASSQALTGADMYHLRVDLEQRIEERLKQTEGAQVASLMATVREELTAELDRWSQDVMDRMDILLGATSRLIAALETRVADLERQAAAKSVEGINGTTPVPPARSSERVAS